MNGNCGECERRYHCEIDPSKCDNLSEPVTMTRADKVRAMSDEELANLFAMFCHGIEDCNQCPLYNVGCAMSCRLHDWIKWLQQPAEVDT